MEDEILLVSKANKSVWPTIVLSVLFLLLSATLFSMAVVDTNWLGVLAGMISLFAFIAIIHSHYSKIYYSDKTKAVITDYNDSYVDATQNIDQDKDLKVRPISNETYPPIKKNISIYLCCLGLFTILSFGVIFNLKNKTNEILYFTGSIESIYYPSKSKRQYVEIGLKNVSFRFKITNSKDVSFFTAYNYNYGKNTPVNLGKKIKIAVSKDDYDWKIKNKIVRRFDINPIQYLNVQSYQMLK